MQRTTRLPILLIILFLLVLIADCFFIYFGIEAARQVSKALLMPLLMLLILTSAGFNAKRYLFIALMFSWFGDLLLSGKGDLYFLSGLGSFLLAHITYIFIFNQIKPLRYLSTKKFIYSIVTPATIASIVLIISWSNLHDLKYPVLFYILAISIMYVGAANVYNYIEKKNILILAGAKLFLASDAMLAINLFHAKTIEFEVGVMITYGIAQLLLVIGIRSAKTENNNEPMVYTPV